MNHLKHEDDTFVEVTLEIKAFELIEKSISRYTIIFIIEAVKNIISRH